MERLRARRLTLASAGMALVGLFYAGAWGFDIQASRPWRAPTAGGMGSYGSSVRFDPLAATALFAGFRGFAADLLWLKADTYWHHGQWQRVLPLYQLIVLLQPRFTLVWSVGAWHMAYNLSDRAKRNPDFSPAQRDEQAGRWVQEGIRFLQTGLKANADKSDLYFDLGWTYFDKVGNFPKAVLYLETAARKSNSLLTRRVLAHAYERAGCNSDALRMWVLLDSQGQVVAKHWRERVRQSKIQPGTGHGG